MKEDIKNIFKGHVDSADTDFDTSALWEAIEAKRKPRKKKIFFYLLSFGLLLCGILSVSLLSYNKPDSNKYSTKIENNESNVVTPILSNSQVKELVTTEVFPTPGIKNVKERTYQKVVTQFEKSDSGTKKNIYTNFKILTIHKNKIIVDSKMPTFDKSKSFLAVEEKDLAPELATIHQPMRQTLGLKKIALPYDNSLKAGDLMRPLQPLEFLSFGISWEERIIDGPKEIDSFSIPFIQTINSSQFDLSLVGSISTFSTSYDESIMETQLSEWTSALSPFLSVSTDLIMGWNVSDRIKIGSGLSYSRLSEKLTWNGQYIADLDGNYIDEVDVVNPVLSLIGTASEERLFQLVDRNIIHYNNYHLVDIPVLLQVKLINKRLELSPYTRASFNLWSSQSGYLLDENTIPQKLSDSVKQTVGIAYGGGLELGYALGEALGFVSRAQLITRRLSVDGIDRRITQPELFIGIRYEF